MTISNLLLCVGAQKGGTTWLFNRMADHPKVRKTERKEMHYFSTVHNGSMLGPRGKANLMRKTIENRPGQVLKYIRAQATGGDVPAKMHQIFRPMDDGWYNDSFTRSGKYSLDFTPAYAKLPDEGHAHIKRISDNQKIIFIMREPLDRALSAVRYLFKTNGLDIKTASVDEIMKKARDPAIIAMSEYVETIDVLERNYAPENLKILFYEKMMSEKSETVAEIFDWLKLDRLDLPEEEMNKRDNATKAFDMPQEVVDMLAEQLAGVRTQIEARFPEAVAAWAEHPRIA